MQFAEPKPNPSLAYSYDTVKIHVLKTGLIMGWSLTAAWQTFHQMSYDSVMTTYDSIYKQHILTDSCCQFLSVAHPLNASFLCAHWVLKDDDKSCFSEVHHKW